MVTRRKSTGPQYPRHRDTTSQEAQKGRSARPQPTEVGRDQDQG